jgi:catechol 2,3-dioxygenase-like lactoylglutathione lyase family enzyme
MITGLAHIAMNTLNISKSADFFLQHFGAVIVRKDYLKGTGQDLLYLQIGYGVIELLGCPKTVLAGRDSVQEKKLGFNHIGFQVTEIDEVFKEHQAEGLRYSVVPRESVSGLGRIAFFIDPNDIEVELVQMPIFRKPRAEVSKDGILGLDYVTLHVKSLDESKLFYEKYLSAELLNSYTVDDCRAAFMKCGTGVIELEQVEARNLKNAQKHRSIITICVQNVEKEVEKLEKKGVSFESFPTETGIGGGKFAILLDYDENRIKITDDKPVSNF